jgi:polar amino acid transport system permease protein
MSWLSAHALGQLLMGLWVSIELLAAVTALGVIVGGIVAAGHLSQSRLGRTLALCFDIALRGLPPVVLLLIVYYGFTDWVSLPSFWAAALALGLRASAYFARIFEGSIQSVPHSQVMAAQAIGLSPAGVFSNVVLPQAVRYALPGVTNELSSQLKLTSIAFVVGVVELSRQSRYLITSGAGSLLGIFLLAAVLYYLTNTMIFLIAGWYERRHAIPGFGAAADYRR